ncbi:MAG: hypothetical protein K0S07_1500 [Chlamydiales bacterium]|jgi:hypothetical protein|nr:hypothetical protein [Chlamydiales bacterium]
MNPRVAGFQHHSLPALPKSPARSPTKLSPRRPAGEKTLPPLKALLPISEQAKKTVHYSAEKWDLAHKKFRHLAHILRPHQEFQEKTDESHLNDIYMLDGSETEVPLVYKPLAKKSAIIVAAGYEILEQAGLDHTMPKTRYTTAKNVESSLDLGASYTIKRQQGTDQDVLFDPSRALELIEGEDLASYTPFYPDLNPEKTYARQGHALFQAEKSDEGDTVLSYQKSHLEKSAKKKFIEVFAAGLSYLMPEDGKKHATQPNQRVLIDEKLFEYAKVSGPLGSDKEAQDFERRVSDASDSDDGSDYFARSASDGAESDEEGNYFAIRQGADSDDEVFDSSDEEGLFLDEDDLLSEIDGCSQRSEPFSINETRDYYQLMAQGQPLKGHPLENERYLMLDDGSSLVSSKYLFQKSEEGKLRSINGSVYQAKAERGLFSLSKSASLIDQDEIENADFQLLAFSDGSEHLIQKDHLFLIEEIDGALTVERNGLFYAVEAREDGSYQVIGHDVPGALQEAVQPHFTGFNQPLDIRYAKKQVRDSFYERIHPQGFIDAFLASLLLRVQDGKITNLKNGSNVLFKVLPDEQGLIDPTNPLCKLWPMLIDTDETLPSQNLVSEDEELTMSGEVAPVRLGLMAFPLASTRLSEEAKAYAITKLLQIIHAKKEIAEVFEIYSPSLTHKQKGASLDLISKMAEFLEKLKSGDSFEDFSLEELTFFLFPTYKVHWQYLQNTKNDSREIIASLVGQSSLESMKKSFAQTEYGKKPFV